MHHPTLSTGWRALLAATVVAAATTVPLSVDPAAAAPHPRPPAAVRRRSHEYGVPAVVLLGVSYLESRWDTNAGAPSTSGGYGPMHLTDARTRARRAPRTTARAPRTPAATTARPGPAPRPPRLPTHADSRARAADR